MKIFDQLVFRLQLIIASDCPRSRHQRDFYRAGRKTLVHQNGGEIPRQYVGMAELADASGLSPDGTPPCGFEPHFRYHHKSQKE